MSSAPKANVPKIDVSPLFGDNMEEKMKVARAIDAASRDTGFFYAINHGIDVNRLSQKTKEFHMSITDEEKWDLAIRAYNKEHQDQIRAGYYLSIPGKKAVESFCYLNPNFKTDHPRIQSKTPTHEVNVWPDETKHPASATSPSSTTGMCKEEDFFSRHFKKDDALSSVVLIRYPFLDPYPPAAIKTAADGTKLSFEWHEDVSLITVLYQSNVQNLQVETPQGYLDIEADDAGYLINCGSYMAHITNNYYPAPIHRTVQPWDPRHPDGKTEKEPVSYGQYLQNGLVSLINKNGQT
ncbi:isopenicillin N synthase [Aspergillus nomiae NRRL 13137]|uniref:Isopenicillin N synthase n=1 Tax=Aspergillus nomiae NRRL (strain ATCC 15546 / NRRL 13137 / CBS 260.88 / M93) TaxID=1509407 RepID=A0A0L1J1B6_ASPN3|nr:isopenicillin N synthase [Aspergillus nomiae NRRL 13137]KNG85435.1 isopenicillin N synthase [Aspergillus nomiae NRRL 13137]